MHCNTAPLHASCLLIDYPPPETVASSRTYMSLSYPRAPQPDIVPAKALRIRPATKSAVTTAQIVSTMKRGENGSSSVSMAPSDSFGRRTGRGSICIDRPILKSIPGRLSRPLVVDYDSKSNDIHQGYRIQ